MDLLDKPNALECFITVAGIVLLFYLLGLLSGKFKDSHDVLAGLMLHLTEKKLVSVWSWYWIWVALSLVTLVVFPMMLGNDALRDWFISPHGLLITLNYTLVVPFFLRAYLELSREAGLFFRSENFFDLGLSFNKKLNELKKSRLLQPLGRNIMSNFVLLFVVLIITALAVDGLKSPWKDFLNEQSCLYYSLMRALNAYLAVGLIFLVLCLLYVFYFGLDHSGFERFLVDSKAANFELKPSIRQLLKWLSWCLGLGPVVVGIHGGALLWEGTLSTSQPIAQAWMAWLVVMSSSALCLFYGIRKFNASVKEALAKKMYEEVERLWKEQKPSLHSYNAKLEALVNVNAYVRSEGKISGVRESLFIVGLPILLQLIGSMIGFIRLIFR